MRKLGATIAFMLVAVLGLIPGAAFAADASSVGGLAAGSIASPSIDTQNFDRIDGGTIGTCDWDIYDSDGEWILSISPSNGQYGYLDDIYYDEDTDGSTAPWYSYSSYLDAISISNGYVLAGDSCNCMFCDCPNVKWIALSDLDTSLTTSMSDMFYGDSSLRVIYVKTLWDTSKVTRSSNMFYGCYSLVGGNGTRFNSSYCDDLYANIDYSFNPGYLTSLWMGDAEIYLSSTRYTYDSKAKTPGVSVYIGEDKLDPGDDYSVSYSGNVNVGTAYVTITGAGIYEGTATATYKITQASNKAVAKKTTVKKTLKAKSLKKKALTVALPKVTTKFGKAKWTVAKKDKKKVLSLNAKTGKIKVKKGAKKGTYTIKVKAKVAKTKNYKAAATKVVTVKVKVK